MSYSDEQLRKALVKAHNAGDANAAKAIAQRLSTARTQGTRSERSDMEERWRNLGQTEPLFPPSEAESMSPLQRFGVGLDKGLEDIAYGGAQLGAHIMPGVDPSGIDQKIRQREEDYQRGGLNEYPAGAITGNVIGAMGPGGIGAKAVGSVLKGAPALLQMAGEGAAGGALEGATMPVAGDNYWQDKGAQTGTGAAIGGGAAAGLGAGINAAESAINTSRRVKNLPAELSGRQLDMNSPHAIEGRRLAQESGVPLSPGQVSGSPTLRFLEQRSRESILSSSRVAQSDAIRANKFQQMIENQAGNVNSAEFANGLQGRVTGFVRDLAGKRSSTGRAMYGEVDRLAQGAKVVQPRNLYDELDSIIKEAGTQEGGDVVKAAGQARRMLESIDKQGGYTAQESLGRLQNYSSHSTGKVFDDVSPGYDAVLKRRIYGALMKDMEETAAKGGSLGEMVKAANGEWRRYSQMIDSVEQSALGKMVGKDVASDLLNFNTVGPEQVMDRITKLRPSQAQYVAKFLEKNMPDQLEGLRGSILKDSVDAAMQLPPSGGADAAFNPTVWLRSLGLTGGDRGGESLMRLKHLFGGEGSESWAKMNDSINIARRMADAYGKNFSGTSQGNQFYSLLKAFSGRLADVAKTTGSTAMEMVGLRRIAESMNPLGQSFGDVGRVPLIQPPRVIQRSPVGVGLVTANPAIGGEQ